MNLAGVERVYPDTSYWVAMRRRFLTASPRQNLRGAIHGTVAGGC
jgi:hypothetical protein